MVGLYCPYSVGLALSVSGCAAGYGADGWRDQPSVPRGAPNPPSRPSSRRTTFDQTDQQRGPLGEHTEEHRVVLRIEQAATGGGFGHGRTGGMESKTVLMIPVGTPRTRPENNQSLNVVCP